MASPEGLFLDGVSLAELAATHGTPCFAYSAPTIRRQVALLQDALRSAGVAHRVFYAMKANRHPGVLATLRALPGVGLDACSPREVELALASGFRPEEISFNAGMLSERDLDRVAASKVRVILDSLSSIRRFGARVPRGTPIGLRFDPGVRAGYGDGRLAYGLSKFGFEPDQLGAAVTAALGAGLAVEGLHMHLGWGLGAEAAPAVEEAFGRLAALARRVPSVRWVNVGGGLGARYQASEQPLPLERWALTIRRHLAPLKLEVHIEPGTFVVGPAGLLLVTVNTVEKRRGRVWAGVDAGHALNPCPALYGIPLAVVPVTRPLAPPVARYAVVGHINEAGDVWSGDVPLPELREGELLALLPAGAYAASMSSDHCLRGDRAEVLVGG